MSLMYVYVFDCNMLIINIRLPTLKSLFDDVLWKYDDNFEALINKTNGYNSHSCFL